MAEMKESSVLFSLKNLMALEQERVQEERNAAHQRAQAELATRVELERQAREQEAERRRVAEERQRLEARREREERERVAAIREAMVEQAHIQSEHKARMDVMTKQHEHELELARIGQNAQKNRLKSILMVVSAASMLVIGGMTAGYFGKIKPETEALIATQKAEQAQHQVDIAELKSDYQKLDARNKALGETTAKQLATIDKLNHDNDVLQQKIAQFEKRPTGRFVPTVKSNEPCTCLLGDPMCGCLP